MPALPFGLTPSHAGVWRRDGDAVQFPTGDGCTARFDDVRFGTERLADLRDGS